MFGGKAWGKRARPNLGTLSIDPDDPSIRPPVRGYISHRDQIDDALYLRMISALYDASGARIDDMSFYRSAEEASLAPDQLAEAVANRVRICDLVLIPDTAALVEDRVRLDARVALELAKPILLVADAPAQGRLTSIINELGPGKTPIRTSSPDIGDLVWAMNMLLPPQAAIPLTNR